MVVSMLSFARAKKSSNFIPSLLNIYLSRSGAKRRVISVLHGLGICPSYKTGSKLLADLKKRAEVYIKIIPQLNIPDYSCVHLTVLAYT
jgi:hypothetical protein